MEPVEHKAKMKPQPDAAPGLETDGKGNVIPFERRTKEDQEKAAAAGVKNPENEAEHPSSMPKTQQGQGGTPKQDDPAGQQGGTH